MPRETVLFACVENAGRSQMAAALFNALADPSAARAVSAGTEPAERSIRRSRRSCASWTSSSATPAASPDDRPGRARRRAHHHGLRRGVPGRARGAPRGVAARRPKDEPVERVREIRDQIRARVEALIARSGWR